MMTIGKNNYSQWILLLQVLSGEIPENNPEFCRWLEDDENKNLYLVLKGEKRNGSVPFNKDRIFDNISQVVGLQVRRRIPFYKKNVFKYAASFLVILSLGLSGLFFFTREISSEPLFAGTEKSVFDPGSKKAFLICSKGKAVDLSETFELKNSDGTIVTNQSEGVLCFQKSSTVKKRVEKQTIYVPKGGEYELILADGTKIYLNSDSRLRFPSHFNGDTREVELLGEAFFEVTKNKKPFIVKTEDMDIQVLGTSFNVNAYRNNPSVNTTLIEGSVQVHIHDDPEVYLLVPENNLNLDKSSGQATIRKVDTSMYTAWVKGEFVFRNQPLSDIFTQLERWYDVEIKYETPAIRSMRFSGSVEKNRPLDYLLNQIQIVTELKYRNEDDKIILY
ncbi:MAG: DUF4974 domain-containing protein [Tannerellaceae bacterium]|nr:DUF4974 domain-containing protein [Tannerellaceae bacterium]